MPIQTSVITVTTTATLLASNPLRASTDLLPVTLRNDSGFDIYLGGSGVTSSTGLRLADGDVLPFELGQGDDLYAIVPSGTAALQVFKQRS